MNEIEDCYQPLYAAIEEYKRIDNKLSMRNRVYDYLSEKVDKKKGKKRAKKNKKKALNVYINNVTHKSRKAWKEVLFENVLYLVILLIGEIVSFRFFIQANSVSIITSVLGGIGCLGFLDYKAILKAIEKSKDAEAFLDYQNDNKDLDVEKVDDILDMLRFETYELREKKRNLEDYISSCEQKICEESGTLANQILEEHGIDAEIELRPKMKQLMYNEKERRGDKLWKF